MLDIASIGRGVPLGAVPQWLEPLWLPGLLALGGFVVLFAVYFTLTAIAPRIAAIARITAKDGWSQLFFWVVLAVCSCLLIVSPFIPYFTFGEDVKVVKDTGLTLVMLAAILVAVWTASVSISEELETGTAMTLLSKPVRRWQFIVGKFLGVIAPAFTMFIVTGALFLGTVSYKVKHEARESSQPAPTAEQCEAEIWQVLPSLALSFMEAVMLASISVAISTRLPMLPNLVICFTIYLLGHMGPVLANAGGTSRIVAFFGQFVATVLPNLDNLNIQAAVATGIPVPWPYVQMAALYCFLYSAVAMLLALFLFENRDLA